MREQRLTLTIESRLEDVPLLGTLVNALCCFVKLSATARNQVEVCVVEAVNNSIQHAYHGEAGHLVEVAVSLPPESLVFDIFDSGTSADPSAMHADHCGALKLSLDQPQAIAESGRGLAIMQAFMDSMEYTAGVAGKHRNQFRLTKRRQE